MFFKTLSTERSIVMQKYYISKMAVKMASLMKVQEKTVLAAKTGNYEL